MGSEPLSAPSLHEQWEVTPYPRPKDETAAKVRVVIESRGGRVAGLREAAMGYVDFLYQMAAM